MLLLINVAISHFFLSWLHPMFLSALIRSNSPNVFCGRQINHPTHLKMNSNVP